ncbi:PREDICTED: olfactory receptor 10Q1-like [Elephantulus edwardii]|uniref:olfactory receptor 10Q1-like n=1 Tax=Elephantulus edwardii TaxID=28737 RepID=UPI0003F06221|nr:PREDICTED: olfactory receptor 10Q1-like [Elephantulus edwardii]
MESLAENETFSSEFILLGFRNLPELQLLFFGTFFIVHLITLAGHTTTVLITLIDSCLQTPMYFFLRNLSTIEICYILVIVPNMLANFLSQNQRMPFLGCALQMLLFIALGGAECFLLAVMAYDRFVAICNPLRYPLIVTRTLCLQMLVLACGSGFALSLALTTLIFLLPFCQSHEINHFFCDIPAVLFLACSDTRANEIAVFLVCMLILLIPFLLILLSYGFIIAAILRIHSAEGRSKAFSTCAGHLLVSVLHYGCAIFIYIRPKSCYTPEQDKIVSLIYTNVTPMLYPMIYCLRNQEVKGALRRLLQNHNQMQCQLNTG